MNTLNHLKQKALLLLLLMAAGAAKGQGYENVLKTDSTSWVTCHLELEDKDEGHAYVNKRDSLLYYAPYGYTNYYCVGRMREDDGRLWIILPGNNSVRFQNHKDADRSWHPSSFDNFFLLLLHH